MTTRFQVSPARPGREGVRAGARARPTSQLARSAAREPGAVTAEPAGT
jgi:hypothetical protein